MALRSWRGQLGSLHQAPTLRWAWQGMDGAWFPGGGTEARRTSPLPGRSPGQAGSQRGRRWEAGPLLTEDLKAPGRKPQTPQKPSAATWRPRELGFWPGPQEGPKWGTGRGGDTGHPHPPGSHTPHPTKDSELDLEGWEGPVSPLAHLPHAEAGRAARRGRLARRPWALSPAPSRGPWTQPLGLAPSSVGSWNPE